MKIYYFKCPSCNSHELFYVEKDSRVCSRCKNREYGRIFQGKYWQSMSQNS